MAPGYAGAFFLSNHKHFSKCAEKKSFAEWFYGVGKDGTDSLLKLEVL
jgi:hypothetical protein